MIAWIKRHEALVLLIVVSVILRLPSLWEPYWYGDEGIYLALGRAFRKGLVWYRDIHDNKPPLLYLLAAFTGTVFWFRLLLMVWFGATVAVFRRLAKKILPQPAAAANLAVLILIILTTLFEGNIANAEIFILLPVAAAFLLAFQPRPPWLLIGGLFSAGFLFKLPAAFDLLALGLWLFFRQKTTVKKLTLMLSAFILPVGLSVAYYGLNGAFTPYVRSALMQNIGYLSSWNSGQSQLVPRLIFTVLLTAAWLLISRRRRLKAGPVLIITWFIWAMFGALLSERPYPHYLIQPAAPLALMTVLFFYGRRRLIKIAVVTVTLLAGLAYCQIRFWQYPILGYYRNFWLFLTKQQSQAQYWRWFDQRAVQTEKLAAYIRQTTRPDDLIFIWGDEPYVYALSERLPVGRYTVAYHIADFNGYAETLAYWDQQPPELAITFTYEKRDFPGFEARLGTDYVLVNKIESANIFRRVKKTAASYENP